MRVASTSRQIITCQRCNHQSAGDEWIIIFDPTNNHTQSLLPLLGIDPENEFMRDYRRDQAEIRKDTRNYCVYARTAYTNAYDAATYTRVRAGRKGVKSNVYDSIFKRHNRAGIIPNPLDKQMQ